MSELNLFSERSRNRDLIRSTFMNKYSSLLSPGGILLNPGTKILCILSVVYDCNE